jgi:hypothetical protein
MFFPFENKYPFRCIFAVGGFFVAILGTHSRAELSQESTSLESSSVVELPIQEPDEPLPASQLDKTSKLAEPNVEINGVGHPDSKWRVRPTLTVRISADDNIFISHNNRESDVYFTFVPGIALGWGEFRSELLGVAATEYEHRFELPETDLGLEKRNYFFARYTPNVIIFTDHGAENSVDQDALVDTQWQFSKLTLGLKSRFQTLSGGDIDVGTRIDRTLFTVDATSRYDISDKTSAEVNFGFSNRDYQGALDSHEFTNQDWLNYLILPKINLGIGMNLGYLSVQSSPNQTFEQGLLRASYQASAKLALNAQTGVEFRQIESSLGRDSTNSVFGMGGNYTPFDGTDIMVDAYRRTESSATAVGENITYTGINARIRQRVLQKYYLMLTGGYSNAIYEETLFSADFQREDNTISLRPSLLFDLTRRSSMELAYEFRRNDSSISSLSFVDNLATLTVNIAF